LNLFGGFGDGVRRKEGWDIPLGFQWLSGVSPSSILLIFNDILWIMCYFSSDFLQIIGWVDGYLSSLFFGFPSYFHRFSIAVLSLTSEEKRTNSDDGAMMVRCKHDEIILFTDNQSFII